MANNFLPTPDPQLTSQLSSAYDRLVQAADHCYNAAADPARLASAEAEQRAAIGLLIGGVLREEFVAGRSLGIAGIPGACDPPRFDDVGPGCSPPSAALVDADRHLPASVPRAATRAPTTS